MVMLGQQLLMLLPSSVHLLMGKDFPEFYSEIWRRVFYIPLLHAVILACYYQVSGGEARGYLFAHAILVQTLGNTHKRWHHGSIRMATAALGFFKRSQPPRRRNTSPPKLWLASVPFAQLNDLLDQY